MAVNISLLCFHNLSSVQLITACQPPSLVEVMDVGHSPSSSIIYLDKLGRHQKLGLIRPPGFVGTDTRDCKQKTLSRSTAETICIVFLFLVVCLGGVNMWSQAHAKPYYHSHRQNSLSICSHIHTYLCPLDALSLVTCTAAIMQNYHTQLWQLASYFTSLFAFTQTNLTKSEVKKQQADLKEWRCVKFKI